MFDWDDGNLDHIAEHGLQIHEAEDALGDPRRIPATIYQIFDERRRALTGETMTGRLLFVVFTHRDRQIRVVTARDATPDERRRYRNRDK